MGRGSRFLKMNADSFASDCFSSSTSVDELLFVGDSSEREAETQPGNTRQHFNNGEPAIPFVLLHCFLMSDKNDEDLAPKECQKQACAIQTCIVKYNHKSDPVDFCRPYFAAYTACVEKRNEKKKKAENMNVDRRLTSTE